MKITVGTIVITVYADAYEDEDGEVTLDAGSTPSLAVSVDLPGNDPVGLAARYCRKVSEQLAA